MSVLGPIRPAVLLCLALALANDDVPRVSVVLDADPQERGPASCPPDLRSLLANLETADAAVRLQARQALSRVDWRHLGWLRIEATRGSAERRLALRAVIDALRQRRWSGAAATPPAMGS
jgi:hypothetical protein